MARQSVTADIVEGAIAGAIATWLMGKTTTALYKRQSEAVRRRENRARGGKTAYAVAADRVAKLAGTKLTKKQSEKYGSEIHWALGIGVGAVYGVLRPRSQLPTMASGLLFGAAVWLLTDEIATPALGLTPGPAKFPWQTHARGLAGHLVLGGAMSATLAAIQPGARGS
ncbi:MAG: DUF1440 domain-containing protein [Chthoniobacterales bacterium]|nr:DUF1440 domain-containing protein [Gemmatimonadaceae bacterium]MBA3833112.1 DUF1440 domain-containing protein [Chthoniobacterales bacterium]